MAEARAARASWQIVVPGLRDPRVTLACALTLWTVLGQTTYYFNRNLLEIGLAVGAACALDMALSAVLHRQLLAPISSYITGLSIGILLESYDWRVFVAASAWAILSKYLLRDARQHYFNPSNFGIVAALWLSHGLATVAPGSQWGADYRVALVIIGIGLVMMRRVGRLDLVLAWMAAYGLMGLLRMALGQGGLVFALGPITGAEFALFTFSMLPDPKASPPGRRGRLVWAFSIAVMDGVLRYYEVRYSMFYSLFFHCAARPVLRRVGLESTAAEAEPWRVVRVLIAGMGRRAAARASVGPRAAVGIALAEKAE